MAWFQVDDQLAMHRKVCEAGNAAMGLWVRAGAWSMANLTEGFVSKPAAKTLGTASQAKALVSSGLWVEVEGGYQFHEWGARQLSAEQIAERRRKRAEAGAKGGTKSGESRRGGKPEANREAKPEASASAKAEQKRTPVPVPTQKNSSYVPTEATDTNAQGISATPGADLVREIVPKDHPPATLTSLRHQAAELLNGGTPRDVVADALWLWCDKPSVGIGRTILASLCSEVLKTRATSSRPRAAPGAVTAGEAKVLGWADLGNTPPNDRKALGQ